MTPSFFLAQINNNTQTQVTVIGADPNASVLLYYPLNGAYSSVTIGTTDSTGHLSATVNPNTYSITSGGASYVIVDGAQSQTQTWPAYTAQSNSSGGLSLSQNTITITAGQATAVSAYANSGSVGTLSVPANTNSSVASAAISGTNIILNGVSSGATTMTVCSSSAGCATLYVTVQQPSSSSSNTTASQASQLISFSPTTLSMRVGDSNTVTLSGSGSYYISAHSNPGIAATSISGSILTVTGSIVGTDNMGICSSGSNTVSCATLVVTVAARDASSATSGSNATISFSPSNLNLALGQTQTVTVTGSALGSYYISANSNSDIVGANLVGNSISVTGNKTGGANVTVCQLGGQCGSFYAYVPAGGDSSGTAAPIASTRPLALSSFSVSSNNVNDMFLGSSVALTFTFSFNQSVNAPVVAIAGSGAQVFGSGSGPYTAIYTMNGNEARPISVDIRFSNSSGTGNAQFTIGGSVPSVAATVPSGSSAGSVSTAFTSYLEVGSTGSQVTALQTRLTALGFYSGPITGTFGSQTEAAVKRYQAKNGIDQMGVVGPSTRASLNSGH